MCSHSEAPLFSERKLNKLIVTSPRLHLLPSRVARDDNCTFLVISSRSSFYPVSAVLRQVASAFVLTYDLRGKYYIQDHPYPVINKLTGGFFFNLSIYLFDSDSSDIQCTTIKNQLDILIVCFSFTRSIFLLPYFLSTMALF